jgi:hypothetical protein
MSDRNGLRLHLLSSAVLFSQFSDLEDGALRQATSTAPTAGRTADPVVALSGQGLAPLFPADAACNEVYGSWKPKG